MRILAEEVKEHRGDSADFGYNHNNDANHRAPFEISGSRSSCSSPRPFSPLLLIESVSRKSLSYSKLPLEPIKLTVLKLDGSSFDITVEQRATVAKLKESVEAAFSHLPKHGIGKVSWPHVWGQFCLCFEGRKLLQEGDSIRLYGVRDGVQLQFVRHSSITYNLVKERSPKQDSGFQESDTSTHKPGSHKPKPTEERDDLPSNRQHGLSQENHEEQGGECLDDDDDDDVGVNITCRCTWAHLLSRLFSYRRIKGHDTSYKETQSSSPSHPYPKGKRTNTQTG